MITRFDLHPDWEPSDIALFVGTIGAVQSAVKQVIADHAPCKSQEPLVARGVLIALQGLMLEAGISAGDLSRGLLSYERLLRESLDAMPAKTKALMESLQFEGRA